MRKAVLKHVPRPPVAVVVAAAEADYEAHRVEAIYAGSDGDATRALFDELYGVRGALAVCLFRASKCTERAAGAQGHYRDIAVGRKRWALEQLLIALQENATYGYGWSFNLEDEKLPWVLRVDLPQGPVRFPTAVKGDGPVYPGPWAPDDQQTAPRVVAFVNAVLRGEP